MQARSQTELDLNLQLIAGGRQIAGGELRLAAACLGASLQRLQILPSSGVWPPIRDPGRVRHWRRGLAGLSS